MAVDKRHPDVQRIAPPLTISPAAYCERGAALYNAYSGAAWQLTVKKVTFLDAQDVDDLKTAWEHHRDYECNICGGD